MTCVYDPSLSPYRFTFISFIIALDPGKSTPPTSLRNTGGQSNPVENVSRTRLLRCYVTRCFFSGLLKPNFSIRTAFDYFSIVKLTSGQPSITIGS